MKPWLWWINKSGTRLHLVPDGYEVDEEPERGAPTLCWTAWVYPPDKEGRLEEIPRCVHCLRIINAW